MLYGSYSEKHWNMQQHSVDLGLYLNLFFNNFTSQYTLDFVWLLNVGHSWIKHKSFLAMQQGFPNFSCSINIIIVDYWHDALHLIHIFFYPKAEMKHLG